MKIRLNHIVLRNLLKTGVSGDALKTFLSWLSDQPGHEASQVRHANRINVSSRAVRRHLRELVAMNVLIPKGRNGWGVKIYALHPSLESPIDDKNEPASKTSPHGSSFETVSEEELTVALEGSRREE